MTRTKKIAVFVFGFMVLCLIAYYFFSKSIFFCSSTPNGTPGGLCWKVTCESGFPQ